jgi:NAD(P)-dependent dehydrogenase (short-subunit alcohol dehydrogenase family)
MNIYLKCLAREEPGIVCMSVRPGIVDTDIVNSLYTNPRRSEVMDPEQYKFMLLQKEKGKLLKPEEPGEMMARLVLEAPMSLTGQFFSWDDAKIKKLFE